MTSVAVVGSRHWWPPWIIHAFIRTLDVDDVVVSGGAAGADTMAWNFTMLHCPHLLLRELEADWDRYGRAAGPIRNQKVVDASDWVAAFWDGRVKKSGTLDTVRRAMRADKCVFIYWNREGTAEGRQSGLNPEVRSA